MSSQSENNKRIAKNTLMLYVRMLFSMVVSLYTSRVVLQTLGVEDYGIFNVVGGIITMFTFINNSMVVVLLSLRILVEDVVGIFPVDIAQTYDVLGFHLGKVSCSATSDTDTEDVELV